MVFLQPVVVNDAQAADQKTPAAEVRVIDRRALEQPVWTGPMLAQGAMDQRSPFGNNAPASNELTPRPRMVNPSDNSQSGFNASGSGAGQVADPMSTTKIPPAAGQPDAGPPPPSSDTTATPGTAPNAAPTQAAKATAIMPKTTPSDPTPGTTPGGGAGATPPTIPDTQSVPPVPAQPSAPPASATLPGASSGASNTR